MSDEQTPSSSPAPEATPPAPPVDPNAKPQDVIDLESTLQDLHQYQGIVKAGNFSGKDAKGVSKLAEFLNNLFLQVLKQYEETPYVQAIKQAQAAKLAAEQAEKALKLVPDNG